MYNPGMGMAPGMEPPEVSSLKSLLNITRIIALLFMILSLLAGLGGILVAVIFLGPFGFWAGYLLIGFIISLLLYIQVGAIRDMVNAGQLVAAKEKTLIWMILGIIFSIIVGILLIIVYVKYDSAISAVQRQQATGWGQPPMGQAPVWQAPAAAAPAAAMPATAPTAPVAPTPPAAAAAPQLTMCPRCGRPATWIPQYSRWYCYNDQQYL